MPVPECPDCKATMKLLQYASKSNDHQQSWRCPKCGVQRLVEKRTEGLLHPGVTTVGLTGGDRVQLGIGECRVLLALWNHPKLQEKRGWLEYQDIEEYIHSWQAAMMEPFSSPLSIRPAIKHLIEKEMVRRKSSVTTRGHIEYPCYIYTAKAKQKDVLSAYLNDICKRIGGIGISERLKECIYQELSLEMRKVVNPKWEQLFPEDEQTMKLPMTPIVIKHKPFAPKPDPSLRRLSERECMKRLRGYIEEVGRENVSCREIEMRTGYCRSTVKKRLSMIDAEATRKASGG